jgi:glycosyltransferase involved in cell wall biosynthesis
MPIIQVICCKAFVKLLLLYKSYLLIMNILAIHNTLWTHYKGDIYSRIHEYAKQSGNFQFRVIHIATTESGRSVLGNADLNEHQYDYEVLFDTELNKVRTLPKISLLFKKVIHHNPDLIYLNGYYDPAYWATMIYAKIRGIKIILDSESNEISRDRIWWKETLKRIFLNSVDGYLCLGTGAVNYLLKLGVKPEKILTNRNIGIANDKVLTLFQTAYLQRFEAKKALNLPQYNFIFTGRFVKIKNLDLLINAFAAVCKKEKKANNWGLILSGDGTEKEALQRLVANKNIERVYFLPSCEWHEVPARYALADVAVLPSLFEPFGFLVNEALVYGMPVIVSERCGSAIDLVKNGENGFTFNPKSQEDLEDKLLKIINLSNNFEEMGAKGKKLVEYFSPENILIDIVKSFDKILDH